MNFVGIPSMSAAGARQSKEANTVCIASMRVCARVRYLSVYASALHFPGRRFHPSALSRHPLLSEAAARIERLCRGLLPSVSPVVRAIRDGRRPTRASPWSCYNPAPVRLT